MDIFPVGRYSLFGFRSWLLGSSNQRFRPCRAAFRQTVRILFLHYAPTKKARIKVIPLWIHRRGFFERQGCAFQLVPCPPGIPIPSAGAGGQTLTGRDGSRQGRGGSCPQSERGRCPSWQGLAAPTTLVRYAQGSRFPLNKLIPCAYSFAIETFGQAETHGCVDVNRQNI